MKAIRNISITLLLCITAVLQAVAVTSIKASVDSTQMEMGRQMAVKLNIVQPRNAGTALMVDKNAFPAEVEIIDWVEGDTTDIGNGLEEIKRALVVQSFDSGVYAIPPFLLVNGPDTVRSNGLSIKVNPVDVSEMTDINPIADVAGFESKWYDWLPDWITDYWLWIVLGIVIIAGGICAYLILSNKVNVNIMPQKKRLPPDQIAFNRLNALKEAQLWEKGQEKEYYTRLIDILRDYLQERFGINAMEMTSSQILKALSANDETRMSNKYMQRVVEIADYVKFAKVRPLPDDNVRSFQNAMQFVEETRPVVTENPDGETDNGNASEQTAAAPTRKQQTITPQRKENK